MLKYVAAVGALLCAYGFFYYSNCRLEQTLECERCLLNAAKEDYAAFRAPYPEQDLVDTALAAELKYLPEDYKLHIKLAADSIVALVAKRASLPDSLRKAVSSFREDDYMRCFWYRWGHKELLCPSSGSVFPFTALDSLACVLLYPTVFNN